jgi:hypothetical protein
MVFSCAQEEIILPTARVNIDEILKDIDHTNMVDERFELVSLVFRLAGRQEYGDKNTDYQQEVAETFSAFKNHPAVKYAKKLPLGYDAVFQFAIHITKEDEEFVFLKNTDSLFDWTKRWNKKSARTFLELLNDFYIETDYAAFYNSYIPFFEEETQNFINEIYGEIDFEWFAKYVDVNYLRCIYSPSSTRNNYGATVAGKYIYCGISGDGFAIIHEYCHSFGNPLAHKWYEENTQFKKWCDDSVNKKSAYPNGKIMAGEYITRAYNVLYEYERSGNPEYLGNIEYEKSQGFPYIYEVYDMILELEK